jgi:hypothetical protein
MEKAMLTKIKTIRTHVGLSRWLAEVSEEPIGYLARCQVADIPSPYAYSPTKPVWNWNGKDVIWSETKHRHYEVFEVPAEFGVFRTEEAASLANFNGKKE